MNSNCVSSDTVGLTSKYIPWIDEDADSRTSEDASFIDRDEDEGLRFKALNHRPFDTFEDLLVPQSEDAEHILPTDSEPTEGLEEIKITWKPNIKGFWTGPGQLYVFWENPGPEVLDLIKGYKMMFNGVEHSSLFKSIICSAKLSGLTGGEQYQIRLAVKVKNSSEDITSNPLCFSCAPRICDHYMNHKGYRHECYQDDSPLISIHLSDVHNTVYVVWTDVDYADSYQLCVNGVQNHVDPTIHRNGTQYRRRMKNLRSGDKIQLLVLTRAAKKKWSNMMIFTESSQDISPKEQEHITIIPCLETLPTLMPGDMEPTTRFSKRECKVFITSRLHSEYCVCGRGKAGHVILTNLQGKSAMLLFTTREAISSALSRVDFEVTALSKESVLSIGIISSNYPATTHPGLCENSVGFHGNNGRIFWGSNEGIQPNKDLPSLPLQFGDRIAIESANFTQQPEDGSCEMDVILYVNDSAIHQQHWICKSSTLRFALGLDSGSSVRVLNGNMMPMEMWTSAAHTETSLITAADCGTLQFSGERRLVAKFVRVSVTEVTPAGNLDWNPENFKEKLYQLLFKHWQNKDETTDPLILFMVGSPPRRRAAFVDDLRVSLKDRAVLIVTDGERGGLASLAADAINQLRPDERKSIKLMGVTAWGYGADNSLGDDSLNSPNQFVLLESRCDQFIFLDWGTVGMPTENTRPIVWFMTHIKEKYKALAALLVVNGKIQELGEDGQGPVLDAVIAGLPVLVMGNTDLALYIKMAWDVFMVSHRHTGELEQKFSDALQTRQDLVQQGYTIEQSRPLFWSDSFKPRTKRQIRFLASRTRQQTSQLKGALEIEFLFAFGVKSLPPDWKLTRQMLIELYSISGALTEEDLMEVCSPDELLVKIGNRIDKCLGFNMGNIYSMGQNIEYDISDTTQHIFLAALLGKDEALAMKHWQNVKHPIACSMVASIIMAELADKEEKVGHAQEAEELMECAETFLHKAGGVLDAAYDYELRFRKQLNITDKQDATNPDAAVEEREDGTAKSAASKTLELLLCDLPQWNNFNLLDLIDTLTDDRQMTFKNTVSCKRTVDYFWISNLVLPSKILHYLAVPLGWLIVLIYWILNCTIPGIFNAWLKKRFLNQWSWTFVKFMYDLTSYLIFLGLFSYFVLVKLRPITELDQPQLPGNETFETTIAFTEPKPEDWRTPVEFIIWFWAFTLFAEELRQVYVTRSASRRFLKYWSSNWNRLDMVMYMMFVTSVLLRFTCTTEKSFVWARALYCITLMAYYIRTLHICYAINVLGPKITMIWRMLYDLVFFLVILSVFMFAYGVCVHAIQDPNTEKSWGLLVTDIIYTPYWQMYGELGLDTLEENVNRSFLVGLLAVYVIVVNVLLLNLLIAMFSHTYDSVEGEMDVRYPQLFDLLFGYMDKPYLPPPIIIFELAWKLLRHFIKPDAKRLSEEKYKSLLRFESCGFRKHQEKLGRQKTSPQDINRTLDELQELYKTAPFQIEFNPSITDISILHELEVLGKMTERTTEKHNLELNELKVTSDKHYQALSEIKTDVAALKKDLSTLVKSLTALTGRVDLSGGKSTASLTDSTTT